MSEEFDKAIDSFENTFFLLTGKYPMCKDKWGSLVLEQEGRWITSPEDERALHLALMQTACLFPKFVVEILDDYLTGELYNAVYNTSK